MWPWGHLAVGYLLYAVLLDRRFRRRPGDLATAVVAFGTQFPDLVDKPLAWDLGVLPNGRSLAHSLLIATAVVVVVWYALRRRDQATYAVAFGVGYLSHLAADAFEPFLTGQWGQLAFLGWPVLPPVDYGPTMGVTARFAALYHELLAGDVSAFFVFQLLLVVLALGLWVKHGYPGLSLIRPSRSTAAGN